MNDTVLEEVKECKDLGVLTDCSLSWNSHTDMITAKANRMLGLIKRTCKDLKDTATLKTLFCSLVRSNLEYCSVVWSPFTKRNIDKLERIQRRATKFILKSNDQYDIRLRELNLLTLEQRRFLFDVTFLFKALNGYMDVDFSKFLDFYCQEDRYSFRHSDNRSLKKRFARANVMYLRVCNETWQPGNACDTLQSIRCTTWSLPSISRILHEGYVLLALNSSVVRIICYERVKLGT